MNLHQRIAEALGWTLAEVQGFSLQALRDVVRPVNRKLANEITLSISRVITKKKEDPCPS